MLTPSDPDPAVFEANGDVSAIARSGGLTYIGGSFTQLSAPVGPGVRFDPSTGRRVAPVAEVTGGATGVRASAPDGAGGYFIGGDFAEVGGVARNNIAHILADGRVDPAFDPNADGIVLALAVSGSAVYAGGDFTDIGGRTRFRLAKLSATSGNAFSSFNPSPDGEVRALAVDGTALYVGGSFTNIGGLGRSRIAKLSTSSGHAFSGFNAGTVDAVVRALAVSGGAVYTGGDFTTIGGQARNRIAKLSATSGNAFAGFNPNANDSVFALVRAGDVLYVGGAFNGANSIGGQPRNRIAKLSATSGNAFAGWNPNANGDVGALALLGSAVYAGGVFNGPSSIGGQPRNRIAKLSTTTGNAFGTFDPNVNDTVFALAVSGSSLYAGGDFSSVNPVTRNRIAALDSSGAPTSFNPNAGANVRALAVSGGAVYAGGDFTSIGGQARNRIAKLSPTSGNAFSAWNPNANNSVVALAADTTGVYVGGFFIGANSIGGQARDRIAKLSTTSGNAVAGFDPEADQGVLALAVDATGVYAGGGFTSIGGQARSRIAKLSTTTGDAVPSWDPGANNGVQALAVSGSALYVGGLFNGASSIGGQTRNRIAKLSAAGGSVVSDFNPNATSDVAALAASGSAVYAGGHFSGATSIGGEDRNRIAKLSATTGNAAAGFAPDLSGGVLALAVSGSTVYVGGEFTQIGGRPREGYAQFSQP